MPPDSGAGRAHWDRHAEHCDPRPPATFDAFVCANGFHLVPDVERALPAIRV